MEGLPPITDEQRAAMQRAASEAAQRTAGGPARSFETILGKAVMGDERYKEALETGETTGMANLRALAQAAFPKNICQCAAHAKPCGRAISAQDVAHDASLCWPCWSAKKDERECFH